MTIRITPHLLGGFVALAALCALPAAAQDGPGAVTSTTAGGEPLSQALAALSTSNGFEVRGLDKVGDETVQAPKFGTPVQALRRMLDGYAYTLELAPAEAAGNTPGKLLRVSIIGHSGDGAGDTTQAPTLAPADVVADYGAGPATADADAPGGAVHPVAHMLQTIARTSMPLSVNSGVSAASGQPLAGAAGPTSVAPGSAPGGAGGDAASNATDMAALTRLASGNLSALVQSLKAACPAGGKC
ncbi:MAG: hypothetical protein JWM91_2518 [Rhodospirillales bacterium]|nr:hypothetical protein [Rhodospirillales bacterium]